MYPGFRDIYSRHIDEAKFGDVKATKLRALKERLTFVLHVLKECPYPSGSRKRTELLQRLLSAKIPLKHDKSKAPQKTTWLSWLSSPKLPFLIRLKPTDEEPLPKEETQIKSHISDSDFLYELKRTQEMDLAEPIHEAFALVYSHLSSLIDTTVNKVTHAVLRMQQDERKKIVKREVEQEERMALDRIAATFIRDVNRKSTGRRTS